MKNIVIITAFFVVFSGFANADMKKISKPEMHQITTFTALTINQNSLEKL